MGAGALSGRTVVVPLGLARAQAAAVARRLAAEGAAVVLAAAEGEAAAEAGRLTTDLHDQVGQVRTAVVVLTADPTDPTGDPTGDQGADLDALVELVTELFP